MTTSTDVATRAVKTAAQLREEERAKRSNIDRLILQNARLSYMEISEKIGIPVGEVADRLHTLLRSRDHLSDRQEERLLIIEMDELIEEMKGRMSASQDQFFADIAAVTLRGYDSIAKRLDARRKATETDISEITRAQGEMFLAIMAEAVNLVATRLEELHPDSEWDIRGELEESFAYALPQARDEVNKKVRE